MSVTGVLKAIKNKFSKAADGPQLTAHMTARMLDGVLVDFGLWLDTTPMTADDPEASGRQTVAIAEVAARQVLAGIFYADLREDPGRACEAILDAIKMQTVPLCQRGMNDVTLHNIINLDGADKPVTGSAMESIQRRANGVAAAATAEKTLVGGLETGITVRRPISLKKTR